jgi:hypothetical protein
VGIFDRLKRGITGQADLGNLSEEELLEQMDSYLNLSQSISIILLLENEKPGVLIMGAGEGQRRFIKALCRKFGLSTWPRKE